MLVKNNQHLVNPIYGLYTFLSCITNKMNQCKKLERMILRIQSDHEDI